LRIKDLSGCIVEHSNASIPKTDATAKAGLNPVGIITNQRFAESYTCCLVSSIVIGNYCYVDNNIVIV